MAFVTLVVLLPTSGEAQFSKIKKAAADAAGVPTTSSGSARYVKKIDMTAAQIGQVNKGLETAVRIGPETIKKWEKAQEAYNKADADYQKKKEQYDACAASVKAKAQAKVDAATKKSDAAGEQLKQGLPDENAMVAQAEAAQAAAERVSNGTGTAADRQTLADFQKTMAGARGNSGAMMAAVQEVSAVERALPDSIKKNCGPEPVAPTFVNPASGAGNGGKQPTSAADEINQVSAAAAGMTEDEYRKEKEKAKGFAMSNTQVQGGSDTPDDEAKAINEGLAKTRELYAQVYKLDLPFV
jgi:hypothetical protein